MSPQKPFSKMIGEDQSFLRGRSFLMEVDPSAPYEKTVGSFADETSRGGSDVFVLTHRSSPLYKFLSAEPSLRFFISTDSVSYIRETDKENEILVPQNDLAISLEVLSKTMESSAGSSVVFVIDSVSDMLVSVGFEATYKFLKSANEILADSRASSMFLFTRGIHDQKIVATIKSLFPTHLSCGADGTAKLVRKP